jgi:tetratricopeptide (TPR) repeat protein
MSFIPTWRTALNTTAPLFAPLLKEDVSLSLLYGLCAGALLWAARDLPQNDAMQQAVREIGIGEKLPFLQLIVGGWAETTPLVAARNLGHSAKNSPDLKAALDGLLVYFLEDLRAVKLIQAPRESDISIQGSVSGGNVNVGGTQVIAGDLIITYLMPKAERACPIPSEEPAHFGGRDALLNDLIKILTKGEGCAITALKGIGGMGKTTLARVLANRLYKEKVFRAVLWADVTRNPNFVTLINGWAQYADSAFETKNQSHEQIALRVKTLLDELIAEECDACEPSRVLVVLDDVWENGKNVARLLMQITTRSEALARDLDVQLLKSLDRLPEAEAAQLLRSYLPETDEQNLRRLGKALGGHPLAMELAARRILKEQGRDDLSTTLARCVAEYEQHIPEGTPFATLKLEQGEEEDDNLTRSLYHSYEVLSVADQGRFRALGVVAYDELFDVPLLQALWQSATPEDNCDTLRLLSLMESAAGQPGMYRQHPILRSYARTLLNTAHEAEAAFARYSDHIIQVSEQFETLPPEQWDSTLASQYPHVLYVGDELVRQTQTGTTGDLGRAQAFAYNIVNYLFRRLEVHRISWLEMGLQTLRTLPTVDAEDAKRGQSREARFLNELGLAWSAIGEKRKALEMYEQALALRQVLGDRYGEATSLNNIAGVWGDLGEKRKALEMYEQALALLQALKNRGGEAMALNNVGMAWLALGEKRKALEYFEQALPLLRSVGDRSSEAATLNNIGGVWNDLGERDKALKYFEQALPLSRTVGNRNVEATTLAWLGSQYSQQGNLPKALQTFQDVNKIFEAIGAVSEHSLSLLHIAKIYQRMGRIDEAIQAVQAGKEILVRYNLPQSTSGMTIARYDALLVELQGGNAQSTLPQETSQSLASNTTAVKTFAVDKLTEWQERLITLRTDWMGKDNDWAKEVAFLDALLAILSDEAPTLPADNSYADAVQQVVADIQKYREQGGESERSAVPSTLPQEYIQTLAQNTTAVKTDATDQLAEWQDKLTNAKMKWLEAGDGMAKEVAFVDALLAILSDEAPTLPADNPYAEIVQQVVADIQKYREQGGVSEKSAVPSTMPHETLQTLASNTTAVKTFAVDKLTEWREALTNIRTEWTGKGDDYAIEVVFADALLAILNDESPTLPDDNPYAETVRQVIADIQKYRKQNP